MTKRDVPKGFVDGNDRIERLLKDNPQLAEKARQLREKWAGAGSNRRPSAFQADARTD
jgi:hypothetical protein